MLLWQRIGGVDRGACTHVHSSTSLQALLPVLPPLSCSRHDPRMLLAQRARRTGGTLPAWRARCRPPSPRTAAHPACLCPRCRQTKHPRIPACSCSADSQGGTRAGGAGSKAAAAATAAGWASAGMCGAGLLPACNAAARAARSRMHVQRCSAAAAHRTSPTR